MRIEVDHCLKCDGKHYVDYGVDDYAKLPMDWFDSSDSHEAELFWKIRYRERNVLQFEPMWFSISREEFDKPPQPYMGFPIRVVEFPKVPYIACADPDYDLRWLSFFKGGVWGVRGDRAFLLVPQPSYLGAPQLELSGDWLLIYGEVEEPQGPPTIRTIAALTNSDSQLSSNTSARMKRLLRIVPSMRRPVTVKSICSFLLVVPSIRAEPPLSPSFHPHSLLSDCRSVQVGCT